MGPLGMPRWGPCATQVSITCEDRQVVGQAESHLGVEAGRFTGRHSPTLAWGKGPGRVRKAGPAPAGRWRLLMAGS